MPDWNSAQYLRFAAERTQPAIDLAARIALEIPRRIIDLGCGPGNSTAVLAQRWRAADITGLDSSGAMLDAAAKTNPSITWQVGDIAAWATPDDRHYDVVFSNAALQWVPDHGTLIPRLFAQVAHGGALAFQIPTNLDAPSHRIMRELGATPHWRDTFRSPVREWHFEKPAFYYDLLAESSARIDLWSTEYIHVLAGPDALVDWYRGTGLRPWLEALPDEIAQARFLAEYQERIAEAYPRQRDGRVLFPFQRLFVIAYR
jgi:trans-aconitate 2-methyltransferase